MPIFTLVDVADAKMSLLKNTSASVSAKIREYLDFVDTMIQNPDSVYTLTPSGKETVRSMRVNLTKAAKSKGIRLMYGTDDGSNLLVSADTRERKTRTPKKSSSN